MMIPRITPTRAPQSRCSFVSLWAHRETTTAHKEGPQGVQQNGGGTDHGIVQIQVPAGHGDTEGAHGNIQRHEHGGNGQPFHRLVFAQIKSIGHRNHSSPSNFPLFYAPSGIILRANLINFYRTSFSVVTRHRPQTKAVRSSLWEAAHCLAICGMFFLPVQIQAMAFSFLAAKN